MLLPFCTRSCKSHHAGSRPAPGNQAEAAFVMQRTLRCIANFLPASNRHLGSERQMNLNSSGRAGDPTGAVTERVEMLRTELRSWISLIHAINYIAASPTTTGIRIPYNSLTKPPRRTLASGFKVPQTPSQTTLSKLYYHIAFRLSCVNVIARSRISPLYYI